MWGWWGITCSECFVCVFAGCPIYEPLQGGGEGRAQTFRCQTATQRVNAVSQNVMKTHEISPGHRLCLYLARFWVTFRNASCFFARFFAAASLAIFKPSLSRRPGSGIFHKQLKLGPNHKNLCYSCHSVKTVIPTSRSNLLTKQTLFVKESVGYTLKDGPRFLSTYGVSDPSIRNGVLSISPHVIRGDSATPKRTKQGGNRQKNHPKLDSTMNPVILD